MKCQKCNKEFLDNLLEESHDVPCYIFKGKDRNEKKQLADKEGRHWLCKKCHDIYEKKVFSAMTYNLPENQRFAMIQLAKLFALEYFQNKEGDKDEYSD